MKNKSIGYLKIIIVSIAAIITLISIPACGKSQKVSTQLKTQKKTATYTNYHDDKELQSKKKEISEAKKQDIEAKQNAAQTNIQANTSSQDNAISRANNSKITIVIDPGHADKSNLQTEPIAPGSSEMKIKDGGGATGVSTGIPEYKVNLNISFKLKTILEGKGYNVIMTKTTPSESPGNVERAEIGNKAGASLVIRIHADSCATSSVKGATMLVPSQSNDYTRNIYKESYRCGNIIMNTLTKEVGMSNRGVVERNDLTGFNWSKVPVILVEAGFLSNPDEDKLLASDNYEQKVAQGLADGISLAFK